MASGILGSLRRGMSGLLRSYHARPHTKFPTGPTKTPFVNPTPSSSGRPIPRPNLENFDLLIGTLRTVAERGLRERFRTDGWFEGGAFAVDQVPEHLRSPD